MLAYIPAPWILWVSTCRTCIDHDWLSPCWAPDRSFPSFCTPASTASSANSSSDQAIRWIGWQMLTRCYHKLFYGIIRVYYGISMWFYMYLIVFIHCWWMLMKLLFCSMFANSRLNELRRRRGINFMLCADLQLQHEAVLCQYQFMMVRLRK